MQVVCWCALIESEATMRWRLLILAALGTMLLQVASVAAAAPGLTVVTPADQAVVNSGSVTVQFKATDFSIVPSSVPISEFGKRSDLNHPGEGHVHLTLDLQPLIVWYSAD